MTPSSRTPRGVVLATTIQAKAAEHAGDLRERGIEARVKVQDVRIEGYEAKVYLVVAGDGRGAVQ